MLLTAFACQTSAPNYEASQHLDTAAQSAFIGQIIRYLGKLPGKGNEANKFDAQFDEHYAKEAGAYRLDFYHQDKATGDIFAMVSRIAPSMYERRTGTGIKMSKSPGGDITAYEEVFRTWKMAPADLAERGQMLFAKMAQGEDLSSYYTKNAGNTDYIEFPDENTRYDTERRLWVSTLDDVLQPYYDLKNAPKDSIPVVE